MRAEWHAYCSQLLTFRMAVRATMETQKLRDFNATARIKKSFFVRYRTESELTSWVFDEQGGSMVINFAQQTEAIPQTFAQFPSSAKWPEILEHARRLLGTEAVGLFGEGEFRTWVAFDFRLYHFTVTDFGDGSQLALSVDDGTCDPTLLHFVERHFAALLSPELTE